MATWTDIPNASLEPGAPARSVDAIALRDNITALAEGATGAPKVLTAALNPPAAGSVSIFQIAGIGGVELGTTNGVYLSTGYGRSFDDSCHVGVVALVAGTLRMYAEHRSSSGSGVAYIRVLKNGVLVQQWTTSSTSHVARQVDVSVDVGDVVVFQQFMNVTYTAFWRNLSVLSLTSDLAVA